MSPTPHAPSRFLRQQIRARLAPLAWTFGALLFAVGIAVSSYFLIFSALLALPFLGLVSALGALAFFPLFPTRFWGGRIAVALVGLSLLTLFFDRPARELDARVDVLANQARQDGPRTWTAAERQGLLMLSATMARAGALMGYSEVSREHMGMHEMGAPIRSFRSVFPRESPTLNAFVCSSNEDDRRLFFDDTDLRYQLAFNGAHAKKRVNKLSTDVELTIAIRYRARSRSFLFEASGLAGGRHRFVLDEGVYWGLEELNALHRYQARWRWTVPHSVCRAAA